MSRAIQLSHDEKGLPLSGRVAAGVMHEAIEQDERLDFEAMFNNKRSNLFALKVSGDSMIEAHIADGDYVIIRRQHNGAAGANRRRPNPRRRSDAEMVLSREKQEAHPPAAGQLGDGADLRERLPHPRRRLRRRAESGLTSIGAHFAIAADVAPGSAGGLIEHSTDGAPEGVFPRQSRGLD